MKKRRGQSSLLSKADVCITEDVFLPTGDLENRAVIREPATLVITNATRSDTAKYRCEVTAAEDQKSFDEIVIDLVVRGIDSKTRDVIVSLKRDLCSVIRTLDAVR